MTKIKDRWVDFSESDSRTASHKASPRRSKEQKFRLISLPDDRGVHAVGGRMGARQGPESILRILGNFSLDFDYSTTNIEIENLILAPELQEPLEKYHDRARCAVSQSLRSGSIPIVLGGGHDLGFPHVAGIADILQKSQAKHRPLGVINVDAHLDVRPVVDGKITSGSPFFLALESGALEGQHFIEFGIQSHCNTSDHRRYLESKGATILTLSSMKYGEAIHHFSQQLKRFNKKKNPILVSFDLDSIQAAHAPGVSAPQSDGFTASEFLQFAELAGKSPHVLSVGFFETAPSLDVGDQTSRLTATAIYRFMTGVCSRKLDS